MALNLAISSQSNNPTQTVSTQATALNANTNRNGWQIQNCGTNALFVLLGSGASSTVFHFILKGGTAANDGSGGTFTQMSGVVYQGAVTVNGTGQQYIVCEI